MKSKSASARKLYEGVSLNDKATPGTPTPSDKASSKTKAVSGHKIYEKVHPSPNDKSSKATSSHKTYEKVSKNDKATPGVSSPNDKASSKTKAASGHKTYEKVHPSSDDKAIPSERASSNDSATPVPKKISVDSKIAPLLEQFERACSNNKACPVQMPGALYSKPPSSTIPKSQSTDILSSDKTSFPKSQSTDLLSPTSSALPKSQSTDLLMPQIPKSQSSTALKAQNSVIPKSQSSAVLKSQKSSLPKQNSSSPKQDSSSLKQDTATSKPPSKSWKPKNSKLQALFHKAERHKRKKKTRDEKVAETHQDAKCAKEESRPIEAIYAVVQKINMDDSLTPQTAALYYNTKEQSSQTPGCWIPPEEVPPTRKDPACEDDKDNSRKLSRDNASNIKFTVGSQYSSEDVYASIKKRSFKAKEEETLPPLPPRLYENVFDDPIIAEHNCQVHGMERDANHNLKAQLQGIIQLEHPVKTALGLDQLKSYSYL